MVNATRRRDVQLQTVIEFEIDADPVGSPDLGDRPTGLRHFIGLSGAVLGVLLVAAVTGVATARQGTTEPKVVESSTAAAHCAAAGAPEPRPDEQVVRCSRPVPTSASAEVAMRAARDAAAARARVWAQTHGRASGGYRLWIADDPQRQRMGSP